MQHIISINLMVSDEHKTNKFPRISDAYCQSQHLDKYC